MNRFTCPRRVGEFGPWSRESGQDGLRDDGCCDFCGSLDPDIFMSRLESGDVELTPTDKNYKTYIRNVGGKSFKQTYRTDDDSTGDTSKHVWTTRDVDESKFYFQHLSEKQMSRFIELYNEKNIRLSVPGHFYTMPFFMRAT
jgi:hypothetical protein